MEFLLQINYQIEIYMISTYVDCVYAHMYVWLYLLKKEKQICFVIWESSIESSAPA